MPTRNGVTVEFTGVDFRLDMDEAWHMRAVAREIAKAHKRKLRRGVDSRGRAIERPDDGGRPLRQTGQLLDSIEGFATKSRGRWSATVGATGTRSDLGSSLRGRNAALLAVQVYGRRDESRRPRNPTLMELSPDLLRVGVRAFDRAFDRGLDNGRASIQDGQASNLGGLAGRALRGST